MSKKLAIVGSHPKTRGDAPWDDLNFDIWTINEAATMKDSFVKRCTGILQIHPRSVWDNPKNANDPEHGKWLKANTTIPVYMIEQYPDVPMAVQYPMAEIVKKFLPGFEVLGGRCRKEYFTTTVGYMAALAAYQGYEEVHFYGVELSVESEYRYQRPGAMFWIGILTQCAKVRIHGLMFEAPLYGIEQDGKIDLQALEARKAQLLPAYNEHKVLLEQHNLEFGTAYNRFRETGVDFDKLAAAMKLLTSELATYGKLSGSLQELDRHIGKAKTQLAIDKDFWFSHHEFERAATATHNSRAQALLEQAHLSGLADAAFHYAVENRLMDSKRRKHMKDLDGILPLFTKQCESAGIFEGAAAENNLLANLVRDQMIGAT
ncbi:MAG: hypothetical protein IMZ71_01570 [Chloroflexi bacterium]|nr:hypothetical protein [Chloroflexota bacterium]